MGANKTKKLNKKFQKSSKKQLFERELIQEIKQDALANNEIKQEITPTSIKKPKLEEQYSLSSIYAILSRVYTRILENLLVVKSRIIDLSKLDLVKQIIVIIFIIFSLSITAYISYHVSIVHIGNTDSSWMSFISKYYHFGDSLHISTNTNILKFPIVYLANLIFGYGFTANILSVVLLTCLTEFSILLLIERLTPSLGLLSKISKILFFTFIFNASSEFFMFIGLSSARNIEYILLIWILFIVSSLISKSIIYRPINFFILLIFTFLVTLSEPLCFILLLIPCISFLCIEAIKIGKFNFYTVKVFFPIFLGLLFSTIIIKASLLSTLNIHLVNTSSYYFIKISELPTSITNTFLTLATLFNTNFSGDSINLYSIVSLVTFLISVSIFIKCVKEIFHRQYTYNNIRVSSGTVFSTFLLLTLISSIFAYIFSNLSGLAGTGRFLSFTIISSAIYFSTNVNTEKFSKYLRMIVIIVMIFMILVNTAVITAKFKSNFTDISYFDQIDEIVEKENLEFGYGGYWNSYSISLITNTHIPVIPISNCVPYYLYSVDKMYTISPDFIIRDLNNDKLAWESCNDDDIERLFGKILKKYDIFNGNNQVELLVLSK